MNITRQGHFLQSLSSPNRYELKDFIILDGRKDEIVAIDGDSGVETSMVRRMFLSRLQGFVQFTRNARSDVLLALKHYGSHGGILRVTT